ncbi:MAG TPA: hypothetical protein VMN36_10205 [Verrucomicrobiales bacterium]|nr:hypothetical protein [Verrucomicrobiales bacterium]
MCSHSRFPGSDALAAFLRDLFDSGSVTVDPVADPQSGFLARVDPTEAALSILREQAAALSLEMPHTAPGYRPDVAAWAALTLYEACRLLVWPGRDIPEDSHLGNPAPLPLNAEACFSADVILQFLPGVVAMARRTAAPEALTASLLQLSGGWPLSSVGIPGVIVEPGPLEAIAAHPSLATLYTDRVLAQSDASRLGPAWLETRIREAAGIYPELIPAEIRGALGIEQPIPPS